MNFISQFRVLNANKPFIVNTKPVGTARKHCVVLAYVPLAGAADVSLSRRFLSSTSSRSQRSSKKAHPKVKQINRSILKISDCLTTRQERVIVRYAVNRKEFTPK